MRIIKVLLMLCVLLTLSYWMFHGTAPDFRWRQTSPYSLARCRRRQTSPYSLARCRRRQTSPYSLARCRRRQTSPYSLDGNCLLVPENGFRGRDAQHFSPSRASI